MYLCCLSNLSCRVSSNCLLSIPFSFLLKTEKAVMVCHDIVESMFIVIVDGRYLLLVYRQVIHKTITSQILTNLEGELIQEWLQQHGPFDAVVDGANMSLINQNTFSFFQVSISQFRLYDGNSLIQHFNNLIWLQLSSVVNHLRQISPSKRLPLVILHKSRVTGGPAQKPNNQKLLESWKKSGALYATPSGSNDDW